ncbi:IgaA/UmoB family intracellular growth attenuator [Shigella flexneri]
MRQGRTFLHDEVRNFPLQHWFRSMVLPRVAAGRRHAVRHLPLDMPFKFTLSWIKGAQTVQATDVHQLGRWGTRRGYVAYSRYGDVSYHTAGTWTRQAIHRFRRFTALKSSGMIATPLPLPDRRLVNKATALPQTVSRQLHPTPDDDSRVSPSWRSAIRSRDGAVDDFAEIVRKSGFSAARMTAYG